MRVQLWFFGDNWSVVIRACNSTRWFQRRTATAALLQGPETLVYIKKTASERRERGVQGTGAGAGGHVKLRFFPRAADSRHVQVRGEERGVCGTFFQEAVLLPRWDQRPEKATPGGATLNPNQDSVRFFFEFFFYKSFFCWGGGEVGRGELPKAIYFGSFFFPGSCELLKEPTAHHTAPYFIKKIVG